MQLRLLSLPREHGAILTLVGATLVAIAVAPRGAPAFGLCLALIGAFLARGPLDRLAMRLPLRRFDATYLVLVALAAAAGAWLAGSHERVFALVAAWLSVAICVASVVARRAHAQRLQALELVAMGGIGASAGLAALAGAAAPTTAVAVALVMSVHAAAAVPLVHGEVRRRDARRALDLSLLALGAVAVALVVLGRPLMTLALAPRILRVVAHRLRPPRRAPASVVGRRETVELAAVIALLLLTV